MGGFLQPLKLKLFSTSGDVHGYLRYDDQRARREQLLCKRSVRKPVKVRLNSITPIECRTKFQFRAIASHAVLRIGRTASGHCFASDHSELRKVLRPPGDNYSLQNVSLLRRPRATACSTLLNMVCNMVSLGHCFPRDIGRVSLEDSLLFRPTQRQDDGSVAGGVSWIRPVVGICGSPRPAVKPPVRQHCVEHGVPNCFPYI